MSYSRVTYVGNGTTTTFAVPFDYLAKADVVVTVDEVVTAVTWPSAGSVQFSTAPANGSSILIKRVTPITSLEVNFQNGSNFAAEDINEVNKQLLFLVQEAQDALAAGGGGSGGSSDATTLLSHTWAAPGAIGGTTPSAGTFTGLTITGSQAANKVLASPDGSGGAPGFRALAAGDIPSLDAAKIGSGTLSTGLIPSLDAAKITTGTLSSGLIPSLDAAKITTGTFPEARGGTNQSTYTKGDVLVATAANTLGKKAVGTDGQVLTADAASAGGVKWATPTVSSSLINYCTNGAAEAGTTGWATYADAAGTEPVDGTGGSPSATWTQTASSPLVGANSFLLTKGATNRQGDGVSFDFTVDGEASAVAKIVEVEFTVSMGGTYADNDVVIGVTRLDTNALLPVGGGLGSLTNCAGLANGAGRRRFAFKTVAGQSNYRLCLHVSSTSANAYTVKVDDVRIFPCSDEMGAIVLQPTAVTVDTAVRTTNSATMVDSGISAALGKRLRSVDSRVRIRVMITFGLTQAGTPSFTLKRDSTDLSPAAGCLSSATVAGVNYVNSMTIEYVDSPASVQIATYHLYWKTNQGTAQLNTVGGTAFGETTILVEEII